MVSGKFKERQHVLVKAEFRCTFVNLSGWSNISLCCMEILQATISRPVDDTMVH